ncbi:uncharacterized protein LOC121726962 [Aricia agestis]|uniref:uncharacterized protein LOC121726962 n=1 Tax=Aricia agestis TaxID=91739 RepID=UPI001C20B671|nr:uncharacterized protein LOC121726962 [Aricia agestis]
MYSILTLSMFLKVLGVIHSSHVKSNSISKLERNNVLNKALWVKRNAENNPGLSVFRLNTFDVDEILDNNNNFRTENGQPTMYFSSFNERSKRDTSEVLTENKRDLSTIKPIKIVDDSYKEAGLLPQTDHYNIIHNIPPHPYTFVVQPKPKFFANMSENFEKIMKPLNDNAQNLSKTVNTKLNLKEGLNQNNVINKMVLDKNNLPWLQKGQTPSNNRNDTVKSEDESTNITTPNTISQRELFKVIGMLTRTFKRIIKQHNDIKVIHSRLQNLNNNFMRNSEQLIEKFQRFDTKYNNVVRLNEKLNEKLKLIKDQQLNLKSKEETLTKHVLEFEKQRKQFLLQQNLFFNIQKQILAQNEKITYKQAQIANRQTIISHRQSNIAKIFKEAHQTFTTEKVTKTDNNQNNDMQASAADSVKIDLFSVKPDKGLKTLDPDILKTKDEQSIDDLIFKFYFNNTFIDDFIRDQLLGSIVNRPEVRDLKIRKPREGAESTVLFPVTKEEKIRERRWIKHPKKSRKNETTTVMSIKAKLFSAKNKKNDNSDPFIKMAMNFCTELGQTSNVQAFNWCVEKILRRLKVIDSKKMATTKPSTVLTTTITITSAPVTTTQTLPKQEDKEESILAKYFPDNDELEDKLKDYDLKPDTEGNVYYDRSLHISDIDPKDVDYGGGVSDVLPGFESESKVDNPALDLQALRRMDARRLSDKIKKIKMAKK